MPEGGTPMRGPAAPTSPGAWDARSEALLGTPALTPAAAEAPSGEPDGIVPAASPATPHRPHHPAPPAGHGTAPGGRPAQSPWFAPVRPAPAPLPVPEDAPAGRIPPGPPPAPARPAPAPAHPTADTPAGPGTDPAPAPGTPWPSAVVDVPEAPAAPAEAPTAPGGRASTPEGVASTRAPAARGGKPEGPATDEAAAPPASGADRAGRASAPVAVAPAVPDPPRVPAELPARPVPGTVRADAPSVAPGAGAAGTGQGAHPAPPAPATPRARRAGGDPVKVLMHRHRELCERAVDPLEIAAGLEAEGFTDRTAARYRHRDVFSLAEELYARVPRGGATAPPTAPAPGARTPWALAALVPGGVTALAGLALGLTEGTAHLATALAGALALAGAVLLAVRRGPLRAPAGRTVSAASLWTLWLVAYAAGGDGLLAEVLTGGPDGTWPLATAPLLGLALSVAPAAWCAHLFSGRARRRLADSRGVADFAAATRPLLLGAVALHLLALTLLLALTGFTPGALALGALLFLARLLTVHGSAEAAASALAAAGAAEALAVASVLTARLPLPGFDALAVPVRAVTDTWGPGAVPVLVCGAAALGLLAHATGALSRASAHTTP
ncbi:hypothetical protein GCM10022244_52420 [Streptomyces gulbargensis]|uniref:Integral membrane protein n=1 Tax=Streptomyces gulbargensis TaxID=364901 RepID=A0ABP7N5D1_9ACTN